MMSPKTKQLYQLFKSSIQRERSSQAIYQRAAELCEDLELKAVLLELHEDELRHERILLEKYAQLRDQFVRSEGSESGAPLNL